MGDLAKIFKAYDIRGVVPDELDEEILAEGPWAPPSWRWIDPAVVVARP